jgi:hypothetical protein
MKTTTLEAIRTMLTVDPTTTAAERRELFNAIGMQEPPAPMPRIITHDQAAEVLACGKRSLTNYVRRGWLTPFRPHGQRRALGFLESDIRAFLTSGSKAVPE